MAIESEHSLRLSVELKKQLKRFSLDVAFEARQGCLGILGPSGCGKSMTLKSIAGITAPDSGRIALQYAQGEAAGGRVLYDSSLRINEKPQARRVGYLFQNYALFPNMTVKQNIMTGLTARWARRAVGGRRPAVLSSAERQERVAGLMKRLRLEGLEGSYPAQLSGGQQQRAALARILAYEPEVMLLDEPFSAMDTYLREGLRLELLEVLKEYDGISILVTHDRDEAYQLCPRLLLMDQGRVLAAGDAKMLFHAPGSCQAARLTGCKNISRIQRLGGCRLRAIDWKGLELTADRPIGQEITAVGIRAHEFHPAQEGAAEVNMIRVERPTVSEMPFEWYVTLDNGIWWKTEKRISTHSVEGVIPEWLHVDPSALILLTGEPDAGR